MVIANLIFKTLKKFQEDWFSENQTKETNARIATKLLFNQIHRHKRSEIISFIEKNKKKLNQKLPKVAEPASLVNEELDGFVTIQPTPVVVMTPPRTILPDCPSPELLQFFRETRTAVVGLSSSQLYDYLRMINPEIVEESETRLTKREFLSYCE